jgi:hypothetical protein
VTTGEDESTLATVQRAALDRARLEGTDAAAHLTLVGALETARETAHSDGRAGPPLPGLVCLVAAVSVRGLREAPSSPAPLDGPQSPQLTPGPTGLAADDELRLDGAVVACRRFDVPVDRAAALAAVPVTELEAHLAAADADYDRS